MIRKGDVRRAIEAALAGATYVVEGNYRTGGPGADVHRAAGDDRVADGDDGACHVTGSMQCPYYVHKALKALLGSTASSVVIPRRSPAAASAARRSTRR